MPTTVKSESSRTYSGESSFVSLLSGWAQQGVQSFFATQRILLDLAMRQNASLMHSVRQQLSDPHHSPTAILTEVTAEGISNFIEGQKILLELGQEQNELLMTGMKERVGDWPAAEAITDLLRRSLETFIGMQQELLKTAGKQTHTWVEAAKDGKPYQSRPTGGAGAGGHGELCQSSETLHGRDRRRDGQGNQRQARQRRT